MKLPPAPLSQLPPVGDASPMLSPARTVIRVGKVFNAPAIGCSTSLSARVVHCPLEVFCATLNFSCAGGVAEASKLHDVITPVKGTWYVAIGAVCRWVVPAVQGDVGGNVAPIWVAALAGDAAASPVSPTTTDSANVRL